jgi:hypothetical protein
LLKQLKDAIESYIIAHAKNKNDNNMKSNHNGKNYENKKGEANGAEGGRGSEI